MWRDEHKENVDDALLLLTYLMKPNAHPTIGRSTDEDFDGVETLITMLVSSAMMRSEGVSDLLDLEVP